MSITTPKQVQQAQWVEWSVLPSLPDSPGTYILLLRHQCSMPLNKRVVHRPEYKRMQVGFDDFQVLYVSETPSLLQTINQSLINGMVFKNDLRKTLAGLMGFRTHGRKNAHGRWEANCAMADEYYITEWIKQNTYLMCWEGRNPKQFFELLSTYDPPLNLDYRGASQQNRHFKEEVQQLRNRPIGSPRLSTYWYHNGHKQSLGSSDGSLLDGGGNARQDKDFWVSFVFALSMAMVLVTGFLILSSAIR